MSSPVFGQQGQNPFDLKFRKADRPERQIDPIKPDTSIRQISDTIVRNMVNEPIIENAPVAVENENFESGNDESGNETDTLRLDSDTSTQNPFELTDQPPDDSSTIEVVESQTEEPARLIEENSAEVSPNLPINPKTNSSVNQDHKMSGAFLALIFLAIFLLLTIIVNINRGLINKLYRALLNENFSALLYRERKHSAFNYLYSLAYVIFFVNVGLFFYLIQFTGRFDLSSSNSLWFYILIPFGIYMTRHTVMYILAHVFPVSKEVNQFNFNIIVFNIMAGLILIPVNLFLAYGPEALYLPIFYVTIAVMGGLYLFRQLRGVLISTSLVSNNVFLFFIYLCTVEILPFVVLLKTLV